MQTSFVYYARHFSVKAIHKIELYRRFCPVIQKKICKVREGQWTLF